MGFEPLVNQRLLPPSFPRYTAIFGREQVGHKHSLLCSSFLQVTRAETVTFITSITIKAEENCVKSELGLHYAHTRDLFSCSFKGHNKAA